MGLSRILIAAFFLLIATSSSATLLSDLVAGATLSERNAIFSGFTFVDESLVAGSVDPSTIDVTTSSAGNNISINFSSSSAGQDLISLIGGNDDGFSIRGTFDITLTSESFLREVTLNLMADIVDPEEFGADAFIGVEIISPSLITFVDGFGPDILQASSGLPMLSSQRVAWRSSGENESPPGIDANLTSFAITFEVPAPSTIALIFAGLLGVVRLNWFNAHTKKDLADSSGHHGINVESPIS